MLRQADYMRRIVDDHRAAMVEFDPDRRIGLIVDEWGCWHPDGSGPSKGYNLFEQQSTMRDAAVSALTLNIFNKHCDKIMLATVAQLVNNLHCLFLSGGENCVCTPTYHIFDMYKGHQGAQSIDAIAECAKCENGLDALSVSASVKDGTLLVTAANLTADQDLTVKLEAFGGEMAKEAKITILGNGDIRAYNDFEHPDRVKPVTTIGAWDGTVTIPRGGVTAISVKIDA